MWCMHVIMHENVYMRKKLCLTFRLLHILLMVWQAVISHRIARYKCLYLIEVCFIHSGVIITIVNSKQLTSESRRIDLTFYYCYQLITSWIFCLYGFLSFFSVISEEKSSWRCDMVNVQTYPWFSVWFQHFSHVFYFIIIFREVFAAYSGIACDVFL